MERCLVWCVALALVALYCAPVEGVVGGDPAAPPEPDAAVVFTQRFGLSSRIEGLKDDKLGYYSFFGIRYAEPPMGRRRFQRPVRKYLAGEMMATKQCLPCPQRDPYAPNRIIGHEDCLCLNVYAPKMPGEEEGCPVVLFVHGGNYKSGSAGPYGGQHLSQKDTILVVPQYRLGSLGYLSTGKRDATGNVGLFDLHTAMLWVQDYIQFFGGDPKRIIVMGQGSGGSAASLLALSPEGRSATGVAALSGAPLSPGAVRPDSAKHAEALANRTGCPKEPAESMLICMRKLPVEEIIKADEDMNMDMVDTQKFLQEISGRSGAGARVEGDDDLRGLPPIVAESPAETLNKTNKRVPMLTGVTSAETSRATFGKYNQFLTNKLQSVKDFLEKDLIGGLHGVVQGVEGLVPLVSSVTAVLPVVNYYQGSLLGEAFSVVNALQKVAEATGDALFNFPAYQSVKSWSSGGPAFLYSFEHVGNLTKGWHFLPGVALAEKPNDDAIQVPEKAKGPSHGDELAYIFEPLDAEGRSMGGEVSNMDAKVRENFVGLISQFAHGLDKAAKKKTTNLFGTSQNGDDQFLKISDKITLDKNFRFCQIALWGNMAERLTGDLCKNLLGNLLGNLPVPLPGVGGVVNTLPGNLGGQLPGQLGGQIPSQLAGQLPGQLGGQIPGQLGFPGQQAAPSQLPSGNVQIPAQLPLNNVPLIPNLGAQQTTRRPQTQQQRRTTRRGIFDIPFDF